jgi:hypothetical protein
LPIGLDTSLLVVEQKVAVSRVTFFRRLMRIDAIEIAVGQHLKKDEA